MEDRGIAANPNPVSLFSPRGCIAAVLRCCRTGRHLANERAQTPPRAAANTTLRLYAPLGFYVPFYYPTCDCSVAFTARPSRRPTGPLGAGLSPVIVRQTDPLTLALVVHRRRYCVDDRCWRLR